MSKVCVVSERAERGTVYKNDCLKDHLKRSLFIRVMAQVGKPGELIFACA